MCVSLIYIVKKLTFKARWRFDTGLSVDIESATSYLFPLRWIGI